jgi:hypothetical protein
MMRVNRRIRGRVSTLGEHQRFVLLYGALAIAIDGPAFGSEQAEQRAWRRHRDELLGEDLGPGRRPYGFYLYELGVDPPARWRDEIDTLRARGLMSDREERELARLTGDRFKKEQK